MAERVYRDVDLDLDDLADGVIEWFVRDGFTVQDFIEGSTILLQARRENLVSKLSFNSQATNVRLTPLARGFRVDVSTGEWLDKGMGAGVTLLARFVNPWIAVGTGVATGYGVYQQLKLPERVLDYVEWYVNEHGRNTEDGERQPRGGTRRDESDIDREMAQLRAGRTETPPTTQSGGRAFCTNCGTVLAGGSAFCHACGAKVRPRDSAAATQAEPEATRQPDAPRPRPDGDG